MYPIDSTVQGNMLGLRFWRLERSKASPLTKTANHKGDKIPRPLPSQLERVKKGCYEEESDKYDGGGEGRVIMVENIFDCVRHLG